MRAKSILFSILALFMTTLSRADVQINEKTFPDEQFRSFILSQPYGEDALLADNEIEGITFMYATEKGIQSLKGIEYFSALTSLYCSGNQLTELDVSKNRALNSLYCGSNQLTSLNVAGCSLLSMINFSRNKICGAEMDALIEGLPDFSGTEETGGLYAVSGDDDGNQMTDVQTIAAQQKGWTTYYSDGWDWYEKTPEIEINETTFPDDNFRKWAQGRYGETLSAAEISGAKYVTLNDQGIQSLKGIEYFTALTSLYCYNNRLAELNLSRNIALTELYCYTNQLAALELSRNVKLKVLSCYQNRITGEAMDALVESLPDLSSSKSGMMLAISSENEENVMTFAQVAAAMAKGWTPKHGEGYSWTEYQGSGDDVEINEDNFPDNAFRKWILEQDCGEDGVLKGSEIPVITLLNVCGKGIQSLKGIEHFPMLTALYCSENQLTELDLAKNAVLEALSCDNNLLTALDLSACRSLQALNICQNKISEEAMEDLVKSLPQVQNKWDGGTMNVVCGENDGNVINTFQVEAAKAKGWKPMRWDSVVGDWTDYAGSVPIGITDIKAQTSVNDAWYDLNGQRLPGKPAQKGIYINNGRKVAL